MNWQQQYIERAFERHIELADGLVVGILLAEGANREMGSFVNEQAGKYSNLKILQSEADISKFAPGDFSCIALIGRDLEDARKKYAQLKDAKSLGIPVVFCMPERKIVTEISGGQQLGVQYPGMFLLASQYLRAVRPKKGAYCEFGVFDGRTFVMAGHALKNVCGKFFAYDSYLGIGGALKEEQHIFKDGAYYANAETLRYNIAYSGLGELDYEIKSGFFQETLKNRTSSDDNVGPISIVHIDVDVYEPALLALEYVSDNLSDGALLLFDDYDQMAANNNRGERRAVREWLANHPEFELEPYRNYAVFCRSFIVHRVAAR